MSNLWAAAADLMQGYAYDTRHWPDFLSSHGHWLLVNELVQQWTVAINSASTL